MKWYSLQKKSTIYLILAIFSGYSSTHTYYKCMSRSWKIEKPVCFVFYIQPVVRHCQQRTMWKAPLPSIQLTKKYHSWKCASQLMISEREDANTIHFQQILKTLLAPHTNVVCIGAGTINHYLCSSGEHKAEQR